MSCPSTGPKIGDSHIFKEHTGNHKLLHTVFNSADTGNQSVFSGIFQGVVNALLQIQVPFRRTHVI